MTRRRDPYDGQSYYCATCGHAFGEFLACADGDCELESAHAALARKKDHDMKIIEEMARIKNA